MISSDVVDVHWGSTNDKAEKMFFFLIRKNPRYYNMNVASDAAQREREKGDI